MSGNILRIFFIIVCINNLLFSQDYEIKFDSLNASGWFGGDSRPGQQRNVAVAQSVTIEQPITLESFAFYFTSPFDSASSASGLGYEVTLKLHIRDSAGVILQAEDVVVADTFTQGWVAWENINLDITEPGKYIFSTYLVGGYDSLPVNSGQGCDLNAGYPAGERYSKYVTNDAEAEIWGDWSGHPWDSNFWLTGSLLPSDAEDNNLITHFKLEQNYPNPFNPLTNIQFTIPESSMVTLKLYDIMGSEVATLFNEETSAGRYEVQFDGSELSSDVYFYRIQSGSFNQVKKMILLK